jgi:hypothetical protein
VDVPPELIEGLTLLSDALDDPVIDLEAILSVLTDDLVSAIPSYLGLIVTLHIDGNPVIVSTLDGATTGRARASLMLSLLPLVPATPAGSVAFFSGAAGAFVELAEDAKWIFNLSGPPILDGHLTDGRGNDEPAGIRGLAAHTNINQAIGVLIEEGHTPAGARQELARRSVRGGWSLPETALQLLDGVTPPGSAGDN